MTERIKIIELSDIILNFYKGMVISEVKDDVVFEIEHVEQLLKICNEVYEGAEYVYISDRKNNYNVNPTIYFELKDVKSLLGIAIVSQRYEALKIANFEKQFSPVPFDIFSHMDEARAWAKTLL
ncbi:hypothetical protein [Salegentibacter salegens]|uniref:SpoIIAA-like n=1 Tax=Salegentibacter salegens TaxID=143223 RepID=A0A1M7JJI4_9FLAO|nr:hypothetical protein [Salegentibacter salegens]PRX38941.1 hypothetical protein LY58_03420 [Salegentibacter salegens]SHM53116.1 hypothetical protein SAMN05878281_0998 [Salegentibacter salegens]